MVRAILAILIISFFISCKEKSNSTISSAKDSTALPDYKFYVPSYAVEKLQGTYTGSFDKGFITIVLNYIGGKNVSGYNLHKGLRRNINGVLSENGSKFQFELKEPGDNPFDGRFQFSIDTSNFNLSGWWKPLDSTKTSSKQLTLTRKPDSEDDYSNQLGVWVPATGTYATDTLLQFDVKGTCEYNFYEKPGDSTSQMISVKGNYITNKDTILIEWQKNEYTPEQKMKLVKYRKKMKQDNYDYEELTLKGHGWKMSQFEGG